MKTLEVAEAQEQLPKLLRSKSTVSISSKGRTVGFLVSRERMEGILESLEILSNPKAMKAIRRARAGQGKYISLDQLEQELDAES